MIQLKAYTSIYRHNSTSHPRYWFYGFFIAIAVIMFLPWTQNIRARGNVTSLRQEQRPQELNSILPGKIIKWYVKEGDFVKAGDTILQIGEVKDDYLDPQLTDRTGRQLSAKQQSVDYYKSKTAAAQNQISAMGNNRGIKQFQLQNKIQQLQLKQQTDSMEWVAAQNDFNIASKQLLRQQVMYDSGLVSLTQLEQRNMTYQNALAKKISAGNKLSNTRQELMIAGAETEGINQDYLEKLSKTQGDQFQSMSQIAGGNAELAKLENQLTNYLIRKGLYYITAPQAGQITRAIKSGIGEIIKEGEMLVEIVPDKAEYAVELFIEPADLPLISRGQQVQFIFDGFPAIVFSGWPQSSYGTFSGKVLSVENAVSTNGKFRILVVEDSSAKKKWPAQLKIGTGARGFALLKNVPLYYELWRNINGFPPDYYQPSTVKKQAEK